MHQVYGTWGYTNPKTGKSSVLCYLASLGRSNVTEVNDDFLERNVPAVLIDDVLLMRVQRIFDCRERCWYRLYARVTS